MRKFDKTKNMLKANLLAESRYLESKGLIKEEKTIETVYSIDELKSKISEKYDLDTYLIDECLEVIFNPNTSLDIVNSNENYGSYISDPYKELVKVFEQEYNMVLPIEVINKLMVLYIIENNTKNLNDIIEVTPNNIKIDMGGLYNYVSLVSFEDGNLIVKMGIDFVNEYKDLV